VTLYIGVEGSFASFVGDCETVEEHPLRGVVGGDRECDWMRELLDCD
jgi:hypothetical protein